VTFRGAFRVDELSGDRWELALERLRVGEGLVVLDVSVSTAEPGLLTATAASAWSDPSRISADSAMSDLRRAAAVVAAMIDASEAFAAEVRARTVELEVVADYDTGAVLVARSAGDSATWADGRPLT
jgi:hypothetical protein